MNEPEELLCAGDALLVVDVQKDFCPGGALPVERGNEVVPVLNRWIDAALKMNIQIYASRDWHPRRHISFESEGGLWPPHCIEDTEGAAFHPDLKLPESVTRITKGVRFDQDQNSVFDQTGLEVRLKRDGVRRIWVGGLAQDVCVLASVLDASEHFDVVVIRAATRPISPERGRQALMKMRHAGVRILE
jgi:nicotinamidase/pyrazinamidase